MLLLDSRPKRAVPSPSARLENLLFNALQVLNDVLTILDERGFAINLLSHLQQARDSNLGLSLELTPVLWLICNAIGIN